MFKIVSFLYHHWHTCVLVALALSVILLVLLRKAKRIPWAVAIMAAIWGLGMWGKSYRKEWRIRKRDAEEVNHEARVDARNDSLLRLYPDTGFNLQGFLPEASRLVGEMHKDSSVVLTCKPWLDIENGVRHYGYYFDAGKGRKIMGFSLSHYTSDDPAALEQEFLRMATDATDGEGGPGLTYGNDYVWNGERDLFGLHTGCHYAYFNHLTFRRLAMANAPPLTATDSVVCHCGDFICDSNRKP